MFEVQGQLENGLIRGAVDGWQCVLTLLERVRKGQGEQPKGQSCVGEEHTGCGAQRGRIVIASALKVILEDRESR